jgi:hypothetical protein
LNSRKDEIGLIVKFLMQVISFSRLNYDICLLRGKPSRIDEDLLVIWNKPTHFIKMNHALCAKLLRALLKYNGAPEFPLFCPINLSPDEIDQIRHILIMNVLFR